MENNILEVIDKTKAPAFTVVVKIIIARRKIFVDLSNRFRLVAVFILKIRKGAVKWLKLLIV